MYKIPEKDEGKVMTVDEKLLQRLENLSHLKISDDKRAEIIEQLGGIVSFVDNLAELDTEGVDAAFSMNGEGTPLREDEVYCERSINDDIIKNAPQSEDHFFVVPKIIE